MYKDWFDIMGIWPPHFETPIRLGLLSLSNTSAYMGDRLWN